MLIFRPYKISTIFPLFLENVADISKKLAEIQYAMQVKVKEEIAIETSFKNVYILEKAKISSKTLESVKYREQVANMREEISKLNKHLATRDSRGSYEACRFWEAKYETNTRRR